MVKPSDGFSEKVRARIVEITGKDPGPFKVVDYFPGTDPEATDEQRIEAMAQSMVRMFDGDLEFVEIDD